MTEYGGAAALKQNNLAALRSALYHTDFATKKELAEQCRLSLAACTALLGEMIDDGQVLELAFAASNGGRPARRFSINPNYAHILCLYTDNNDVERSGIALLNPDILFLTGSATLNVREKDIIDYCKQSIPENHMPVFRMQADIHEEYMTGIFSLTRQALKFKH